MDTEDGNFLFFPNGKICLWHGKTCEKKIVKIFCALNYIKLYFKGWEQKGLSASLFVHT